MRWTHPRASRSARPSGPSGRSCWSLRLLLLAPCSSTAETKGPIKKLELRSVGTLKFCSDRADSSCEVSHRCVCQREAMTDGLKGVSAPTTATTDHVCHLLRLGRGRVAARPTIWGRPDA